MRSSASRMSANCLRDLPLRTRLSSESESRPGMDCKALLTSTDCEASFVQIPLTDHQSVDHNLYSKNEECLLLPDWFIFINLRM